MSLVIQGRSDPIPTPLEASCSLAQQVVLSRTVWIWSARPTLSGRVRFGPPHGYPGVTSPTVAPERFSVEPQHIFVEGLDRVVAERLDFVRLFVREFFMSKFLDFLQGNWEVFRLFVW